mmetsp:Transcript_30948/g.65394  ORF Transcript_30948/g.65394 Transcript_30948/m.65394 type:complete len:87 (-) Transcript_30948:228-488(-)
MLSPHSAQRTNIQHSAWQRWWCQRRVLPNAAPYYVSPCQYIIHLHRSLHSRQYRNVTSLCNTTPDTCDVLDQWHSSGPGSSVVTPS